MKTIAIIPARMGSSRFPGKPMAKINGIPMIGHCYHRTAMCNDLMDTYVATCDKEIFDYIKSIGGKAVMTSDKHERATDRTAEAMLIVEQELQEQIDLVVMVQGDEPMLVPEMIRQSIQPFTVDKSVNVVNLMANIQTVEEFEDMNEVKVVVDLQSDAIYFSREPIPSSSKYDKSVPMLKQVCIIPFRRDYLLKFNELPPTPLEEIESIDMLRIIENGMKVKMVYSKHETYSVDTIAELKKVEKMMVEKTDQYKQMGLDVYN